MFARPILTQLRDQAVSDVLVSTGLPTLLRRSPLRAMAYSLAALTHGNYGYLDWIARQGTPFTSSGAYLEAWGALVGINRLGATTATGSVTLSGSRMVPAGTSLRRSDGSSYVTTADLALSGSGTVAVVAATAGAAGTLAVGSTLALAAPIYAVNSLGVVASAAAGSDQEGDDALRTRILQRWAEPPQGGSLADYQEWLAAIPGVTRAWVNPLGQGAGTVVVYTMFDIAEPNFGGFPQGSNGGASGEARIAPATGDQLAVANALYPLRPLTALVVSVAPLPAPVNFTIACTAPVPSAVQTAVQAAIDAAFLLISTPLDAELPLSPFEAAIAAVPGMPSFTMLSPASAITAPLGYLPVRGLVSFV